jgi:hypothetical protein
MTSAPVAAHAPAKHATRGVASAVRPRGVGLPARSAGPAVERFLQLQRTAGNAAVAQMLSRYALQQAVGGGLRVGPPNDRFEREAHAASAAVAAGRPVRSLSRVPATGPEQELQPATLPLAQGLARPEDERVPQRLAQPLCAACGAEERGVQRVPAEPVAGGLDTENAARAMAAAGSGAALEPDQRRGMEQSFGRDLRAVRVHSGAAAQRAATALQARAFASGNDIFLGAGESPRDRALMAHELAHVVQQTGPAAAQAPRPVARLARGEALPASPGTLQAQRTVNTVQREEGDTWDAITGAASELGQAASDVGDALLQQALALLPASVAAAIREIQAQGILGYLGSLIRREVGAIFGRLADMSPALATAISGIEDVGGRIGAILGALAGGDCEPLFAAIASLQSAIGDAAGAAWNRITEFLAPVGEFFRDIWNRFGAPTIDWLKQVAQESWDKITGLGQQIWAATGPLRDALGATFGAAWGGIKRLIGIGDEGESGGGLIGWVSAQANRAWEGIKALAAPVLEPIGRMVAKVQEVLPLSAIMDLRGTVQGWLDKVSAAATSLGQPDTMGSEAGQGSLRDTLLPALNNAISGVQGGAQAAAGWVSGQIGGLAQSVTGVLDEIGQNPVLGVLSGGLSWLRGGVDQLSSWAQAGVGTVFGLVDQGLASLGGFARRALDFLLQLGATLGDLAGRLGDLVVGSLWRAIPACIRDPVVDFLVNQVLRRIPVFSQLLDVPDLWKRVSGLAMTLIRQVFIDGDLAKAAWTFFSAMLNLIGLPPDLVTGIMARAASVLGDILRDPVGFLKNLLQAMKEGISSFLGNALTHLLAGVSGWLFGQAQKAGLTPPADFSLGEVFRFVLDVLGLGTDFIFERLSKATGIAAATLRRGVELAGEALSWISDIITEGPAALWRHVKDQLSNLWDTVLDAVVSWVSETIVAQAIKKLLTSLDPSGIGAVVNSIIAIYNAIESAVEYLRPMLEIVKSVLDGVGDIARGATAGAAAFVERSMAQAVPIVVGFLANQVGLGDAGHRIAEMVEKLRKRVTAVVDRLIEGAKGLLKKLGLGGGRDEPDTRTDAQKKAAVHAAVTDAEKLLDAPGASPAAVRAALPALKTKHSLTRIELKRSGDQYSVAAKINPDEETPKKKLGEPDDYIEVKAAEERKTTRDVEKWVLARITEVDSDKRTFLYKTVNTITTPEVKGLKSFDAEGKSWRKSSQAKARMSDDQMETENKKEKWDDKKIAVKVLNYRRHENQVNIPESEWEHIIEQSNTEIHSSRNLALTSGALNNKLQVCYKYAYSSDQAPEGLPGTDGMSLRDYLSGKPLRTQYLWKRRFYARFDAALDWKRSPRGKWRELDASKAKFGPKREGCD